MHFRIDVSITFPGVGTVLLQLNEEVNLRLDDKLFECFPSLPRADRITLGMLGEQHLGPRPNVRTDFPSTRSSGQWAPQD
jgi:hypothetical protein